MIHKSTIQLLRFPFSFFLLPVYLFAVSQVTEIDAQGAIFCLLILHLLVYPSSNGYNAYMDRDTGSIGGVAHPLPATRQLLHVSIGMDVLAVLLSLCVSSWFAAGVLAYILASRAYSARSIRLKKHPLLGYFTVVLFQGVVAFLICFHAASIDKSVFPWKPALIAGLLIGASYPLTQVYQHKQDGEDGVNTISMVLGVEGTFIFCFILNLIALPLLVLYWKEQRQWPEALFALIFFVPPAVYMQYWFRKIRRHNIYADHLHAMRMNMIASFCSSLAFGTMLIWNHLE